MLRILATSPLLACGIGLVSLARSQDVGPGPPVPLVPMRIGEGLLPLEKTLLVPLAAIRNELALTPAQMSRLDQVEEESRRAEQLAFRRFQDRLRSLGPNAAPDAGEGPDGPFQEELNAIGRRKKAAMLKVLDRRQITRLDQIGFQIEGPVAFSRPEVQERLRLDREQVETIRTLIGRGRRRIAEGAAVPAGAPPSTGPVTPEQARALYESKPYQDAIRQRREEMRGVRRETLQAIMKLLRKDQHAQYVAMLGEPFDLARLPGGHAVP